MSDLRGKAYLHYAGAGVVQRAEQVTKAAALALALAACNMPGSARVIPTTAALEETRSDGGALIQSRLRGRYCWADRGAGLPRNALVRDGEVFRLDPRWPWTDIGEAVLFATSRSGRWAVAGSPGAGPGAPSRAIMVSAKGETKWRIELSPTEMLGGLSADDDGGATMAVVARAALAPPKLVQVSPYGRVEWTIATGFSPGGSTPVQVGLAVGVHQSCIATSGGVACFDRAGDEVLRSDLDCRTAPSLSAHTSGVVAACWAPGPAGGVTVEHITGNGRRWSSSVGRGLLSPSDVLEFGDRLAVLVIAAMDGRLQSNACAQGSPISPGQAAVLVFDRRGHCRASQYVAQATLQDYRFMPGGGQVDLSLVPREARIWTRLDPSNPFVENGRCRSGFVYEMFSLSFE